MQTKLKDYKNSILNAYAQEDAKAHEIRELAINVDAILQKKLELMQETRKIYGIVFKNFISVKKSVLTNFGNEHEEIFLNRDGISVKSRYVHNSSYIDSTSYSHRVFFDYLKRLKKEEVKITEAIPREDKKEIFGKFVEKIEQIDVENEYQLPLNLPITIPTSMLNFLEMQFSVNKRMQTQQKVHDIEVRWLYSKDPANIKLMESDPKKVTTNFYANNEYSQIDLRTPSLSDRLLISQFYDELIKFYDGYKTSEQIKLNNLQDFLNDIKHKFTHHLVLESLKPAKKSPNA